MSNQKVVLIHDLKKEEFEPMFSELGEDMVVVCEKEPIRRFRWIRTE